MGRFAFRLLSFVLVVVIAAGAGVMWGYAEYARPGPLVTPTTIVIPRGAGVDEIADLLAREGVLKTPLVFRVSVRVTGADKALQAGEYSIPAAISTRELVVLLTTGKTVRRRLTIPEGLTSYQIVEQIRVVDGLAGDVPDNPPDGTLLPETYQFAYGDARTTILERMRKAMDELLAEMWDTRFPELPFAAPQDAVILASIVEKETGQAEERGRIAAVFINRLRKGMRLQSDPTTVYALTGGRGALGRPLTRTDIKIESPFNTYFSDGLPPGAICNPGRAAIAAVLRPPRTDELYFVADGSGGHVFSRTLDEHNRAVARWRKIRREQLKDNPPADDEVP